MRKNIQRKITIGAKEVARMRITLNRTTRGSSSEQWAIFSDYPRSGKRLRNGVYRIGVLDLHYVNESEPFTSATLTFESTAWLEIGIATLIDKLSNMLIDCVGNGKDYSFNVYFGKESEICYASPVE